MSNPEGRKGKRDGGGNGKLEGKKASGEGVAKETSLRAEERETSRTIGGKRETRREKGE